MTFARSIARRIRGGLKRRVKQGLEALGVLPEAAREPAPEPAPAPTPVPEATTPPSPVSASPAGRPAAAVAAAVSEPPRSPAPAGEATGLTREVVEELLEDMVRPALQSDGGDITLVRVDPEGDVFVELVGACSSCPSATVTMRQGIERLFEAELPGFRSLVEVNGVGELPAGAM